jgi:hypothetical protein
MNGDDILEREVGEIITNIQEKSCVKGCSAHPFVVQGEVKSLRIAEHAHKLNRWTLYVAITILISVWIKGVSPSDILSAVIKVAGAGQ